MTTPESIARRLEKVEETLMRYGQQGSINGEAIRHLRAEVDALRADGALKAEAGRQVEHQMLRMEINVAALAKQTVEVQRNSDEDHDEIRTLVSSNSSAIRSLAEKVRIFEQKWRVIKTSALSLAAGLAGKAVGVGAWLQDVLALFTG